MDDDDDDFDEVPVPPAKRPNFWIVVSAFFELLATFCKAGGRFFDTVEEEFLTKWRYDREQRQFQLEASRAIEMIVSGDYDAPAISTSRSVGPGASESKD